MPPIIIIALVHMIQGVKSSRKRSNLCIINLQVPPIIMVALVHMTHGVNSSRETQIMWKLSLVPNKVTADASHDLMDLTFPGL